MRVWFVERGAMRFTPPPSPPRGQQPVRLPPGAAALRHTEIATGKARWDLFGASAAQAVVIFFLAWIPILYVQSPPPPRQTLTMMTRPLTEYEPPQRQLITERAAQPQPVEPLKQQDVKPMQPLETRIHAPQPRRREMRVTEAPEMAATIRPSPELNLNPRPSVPRPPVHTGVLNSPGSSEQPTLAGKRASEVQTGGFGDPNGVPAKGRTDKAPNINKVGSFGLPPGHGQGNGTGGTKGARGVVESAGFGNGVAKGEPSARGNPGRGVQGTAFGDAAPSASAGAPSQTARAAKPERVAVEILQKPNPAYTAEARRRRIEGDVKLRVVFASSGELRVAGVLQGLGYGLDEAAIAAAKRIKFRPARVNGHAVDEPAVVTIEFKLAY
ncbi:MAG: energy transducer TonB [Verrucomicrobiales bacterium]|nr:energy transducer TonB [Verrucomicrobiales bacterium]